NLARPARSVRSTVPPRPDSRDRAVRAGTSPGGAAAAPAEGHPRRRHHPALPSALAVAVLTGGHGQSFAVLAVPPPVRLRPGEPQPAARPASGHPPARER